MHQFTPSVRSAGVPLAAIVALLESGPGIDLNRKGLKKAVRAMDDGVFSVEQKMLKCNF